MTPDLPAPPPADSTSGDAVRDVTIDQFEAVVAESSDRLVVIDFWAPWCGPCRSLGPILEKVARESNGRVLLAKVNTDTEQQLAGAFGVQSLPTVVAMKDGQPVDAFQGAMPEDQVREWIGKHAPSPAADLYAEAEQLQHSDVPGAIAKLREAVGHQPDHPRAELLLARLLVEDNQTEAAADVLDTRRERLGADDQEASSVRSMIDLKANAESNELAASRQNAEAAPDDLAAQLAYAEALASEGKNEQAMQIAIEIVRRDRGQHRESAKAFALGLFERLGGSPLVSKYRKQLTTLLY